MEEGNKYIFEEINYNPLLCDSRKWKSDRSPYHQCKMNKKIGNLCIACHNKKINNRLWEGLITEQPPKDPICISKTGKKTKKYWIYPENNDHSTIKEINEVKNTSTSKRNNPQKKKEKREDNDHFVGGQDHTYEFEDYRKIFIDNKEYKLNTHDNQLLTTDHKSNNIILGLWDKESGKIIKD